MQLDGLAARVERLRGPRLAVEDLAVYENHGGHTLRRHVGLTDADAMRRIKEGAPAAGCFLDRATAQRAVDAGIQQHRDRIAAWLWGGHGGTRYAFVEELGHVVGTMLTRQDVARGATQPAPATAVRCVLRASDTLPSGFTLVTAYPTRTRHSAHHRGSHRRREHTGVPA